MNQKALWKLTYGLYLLTAQENGQDNGCIINTAVQVAENPVRVSISVIKGGRTHDMVLATGKFNLSALTVDAPFGLFQHFGMSSGRETDKFAGRGDVLRNMGFCVIAEGVETTQELELLTDWGVDMIQGFYFSPPVSCEKLLELLGKEKAKLCPRR